MNPVMPTDEELVNQAWQSLRRTDPWARRDCYWAMDLDTWRRFVCLAHPRFQDVLRRNGPQAGDQLFGYPVVVSEEVIGLNLIGPANVWFTLYHEPEDDISPAPPSTVAAMPAQHVPAHPRTQAIDDEFGWQDAHVMAFDTPMSPEDADDDDWWEFRGRW